MRPTEHAWPPLVRRIPFLGTRSLRLPAITSLGKSTTTLIALSCVWLLMVLLSNPAGEFPLNDDWSYSRAVQNLVEHGRLELTGFTSMPLIAQVLWGALFCLPFGFSFTALRVSTITLGLLGLFATYGLLKEMRVQSKLALLAVVVLAMNPLYFLLSLTFMTDVPFFTFSMLALLFLLRALRTESHWDLMTGFVFTLVAILIRQLAVVIPLSFLAAYLVKNRISLIVLRSALIPAAASVSLLLAFPAVLRRTIGLPALYNRSFEPIAESAPMGLLQIPLVLADRLLVELIYLGLLILPLLLALGINIHQASSAKTKRLSVFMGSALFAAMLGFLLWQSRMMPLIGNVLFDIGLGPALLRDNYLLGLPHWPAAPKEFWLIVTAAAVLGSVLLIHHLSAAVARMIRAQRPLTPESRVEQARMIFLLSAAVLYSVAIGITGFLDRYLIWPLPLLMCIVLTSRNTVRLRTSILPLSVAVVLALLYGLFALGGTHDYLAWSRARWQALTDLTEKDRISYTDIDGGFEFNGWYAYDATYRQRPPKSWWWVENDDYMISFGPISGYAEMRRYPFEKWIPPGQANIFVLQRVAGSTNGE
jgi:hypothetical protein